MASINYWISYNNTNILEFCKEKNSTNQYIINEKIKKKILYFLDYEMYQNGTSLYYSLKKIVLTYIIIIMKIYIDVIPHQPNKIITKMIKLKIFRSFKAQKYTIINFVDFETNKGIIKNHYWSII